jgi:preprotein translocase subunit SecF
VEIVGPRAGQQLRRQGLSATLGAPHRRGHRNDFHDVVITLELFSLTNREIDLVIVAALLTLIGYSINDKIVVFDRVRETEHGLSGRHAVSLFLQVSSTSRSTRLRAGCC